MTTCDGIVLGAGHNGLILQAYACRAGLEVIALERRAEAGGGLTTEENPRHPGFLHNTHAFFHRALTDMPWYRDLELARHGARYLEPELNVALILPGGRSLQWWTDFERTAASFARFSERDAATLRRWHDAFRPVVERILIPEASAPPLPPARRRALLEQIPEGRRLLEVSALSPLEFVQREFEHPVVRPPVLQWPARGRSQGAWLRPPHPRPARQSGQGADDGRRRPFAGARPGGGGAGGGRRHPHRRGAAAHCGRARLDGDPANWDRIKDAHGQAMLKVWRRFAPNLEGAVIDAFTRSPLDVERTFPNMRHGDLLIGAFTHDQIGYHRPFPGAGHYRGHLDGLYLCGSCCHPGGNITGLPGYNAAQVVFADLGHSPDWMPPPLEERLAARA